MIKIQNPKQKENLQDRPPVVVILGHVDHGKSSLLEAIKDFKITAKESGGITQHIGAYEIEEKGKKITFIDTPGHEAFSAMRSRGAKIADIAVLVVAGEEGVKPQTKEAISHIKKAGISMIVAINKMDKPEADPGRVKRELVNQDVLVESMAGKIPSVEISAKTGKGIPELLELILLIAEMEDLKADVEKPAEGVIVESFMDSKRGPTATLISQSGILKIGDILGSASSFGKVKIMEDFQGRSVEKSFPSMPVVVLGFEDVPGIGEQFKVFFNTEQAQKELRKKDEKAVPAVIGAGINSLERVLNIILKVDVLGSLEAIEEIFKNLPQEKVTLRILKAEVGEINDSDIRLAKGGRARIIGFRVKTNPIALRLAEREKIKIMTFGVIYELVQAVRQMLEKKIEAEVVRTNLGKVKVLVIFRTEKNRQIVGGKVIEGEARKGVRLEVYRKEEKVGSGKLVGLQRDKKETDKVAKGTECGMLYEGNIKIEERDILLFYIEERKKGEL